ncbi:hypothetical protein [Campylobacter concisus]
MRLFGRWSHGLSAITPLETILEAALGRRDFYAKRIDKDRLFEILN